MAKGDFGGKVKGLHDKERFFPWFTGHAEARGYFEDRFGDALRLVDVRGVGESRCWRYHLVLDAGLYDRGRGPARSYQPIDVFEDGSVHVARC